MRLSTHKAKAILKKWLAIEKQHGDEASAEVVKEKAREWNERKDRVDTS